MILASLALCTGCPSDPIDNPQDASAQVDGGGNDGGGKDTPTGGWEDIKLHPTEGYVAVEISTPDGKPADFYICTGGSCGSYDTLPTPDEFTILEKDIVKLQYFTKAPIEGKGIEMEIRIARPNYLFVDWKFFVKGNPDTSWTNSYTHEWKDVGSWGLAPNKSCTDSFNGKKKSVSTSIKNGKVVLTLGSYSAWTTGNSIVATDESKAIGINLTGTISDDGTKIEYQLTSDLPPEDHVLTCQ